MLHISAPLMNCSTFCTITKAKATHHQHPLFKSSHATMFISVNNSRPLITNKASLNTLDFGWTNVAVSLVPDKQLLRSL